MKKKTFLVVSPHPDDAELGLGGVIVKLIKLGHHVSLLDLTNGEPTPLGTPEKRAKETGAASEIMGVTDRITLDFPNRYLMDTLERRLRVAEIIRKVRPDVMFCPYPEDAHPDHIATKKITEAARFYAKYTKMNLDTEPHYVPKFFYFFCTHLRINPPFSFLVDISDEFETKLEAIKQYKSQFVENEKNHFVFDYMKTFNSYFGTLLRVKYAEPLYAPEEISGEGILLF